MGRFSTGAITTGECLHVLVSAFTTHIKKGSTYLEGSINYQSGASIGVSLSKTGNTKLFHIP
jgi:hypothetical protein